MLAHAHVSPVGPGWAQGTPAGRGGELMIASVISVCQWERECAKRPTSSSKQDDGTGVSSESGDRRRWGEVSSANCGFSLVPPPGSFTQRGQKAVPFGASRPAQILRSVDVPRLAVMSPAFASGALGAADPWDLSLAATHFTLPPSDTTGHGP
jgi:hypothetical protein